MSTNGAVPDIAVKSPSNPTHSSVSTRSAVFIILAIFICSIGSLFYVYMKFPKLDEEERQYVKVPYDMEDAKKLGKVLERYKDKYFFEVLMAVLVTYIFYSLQTFAIPGSISLSVISGFLFPFPLALGLVCFCSATGASLCYLISYFIGRRLIHKYFPEKAKQYSATVAKHKEDLFNYILFLRVTPILPNWFINIVAPVIDVPLSPFWLGTFIGVGPPSFLAIQTGRTLHELSGSAGSLSWTSAGLLLTFAVLSLLPIILKNRLKKKFD